MKKQIPKVLLGSPRIRLGQCERHLLRTLPDPGQKPMFTRDFDYDNRKSEWKTTSQMVRRALRKLERIGLIERIWGVFSLWSDDPTGCYDPEGLNHRFKVKRARLTPVGKEVAEYIREWDE